MATKKWHREEPRDVRPFFATIEAERCLDESAIQLFGGGETSRETSFDLDEIELKKLEPVVQIRLSDPARWLPDALRLDDLELVLIGRHSFLKRSNILLTATLTELLPRSWAVDANVLAALGGGRDLQLTLAVCLRNDRPPAPGVPFMPGHWIARKSFLMRSRTTPTLFDLRVRNDDEWIAAGYPAKTFYAVEYLGGIEAELEEGGAVATVHIHIDAHNKMVSAPIGEVLQPVLGAEIIAAILMESLKDWESVGAVETASPLATLLKQLGNETPLTVQALKLLVRRPPLLKAVLQDRFSVIAAIK